MLFDSIYGIHHESQVHSICYFSIGTQVYYICVCVIIVFPRKRHISSGSICQ